MFKPFSKVLVRAPSQSLQNLDFDDIKVQYLNNQLFQDGIYLSSRELWNQYKRLGSLSQKEKRNVESSMFKYWTRNCTRCTPYATFAGCALASLADRTELILHENSHNSKIRIDTNYLLFVIQSLIQIPQIKYQIKYFANNSIYETFDSLRYIEYTVKNRVRNYYLSSVDNLEYIKTVIDHAKKGASLEYLAKHLQENTKATLNDAFDFLDEMISSQLLVSELEPPITGIEPIDYLIERIRSLSGINVQLKILEKIKYLSKRLDGNISLYSQIEEEMKKLDSSIEVPKDTLQVDLFLSMKSCLIQKEIIDKIVSQVSDLAVVFAQKEENNDLEKFKRKFHEKYEDAEIPLSIALDTDLGIGYGDIEFDATSGYDILNDLLISPPNDQHFKFDFDPLQEFILQKYIRYIKNGDPYIEIFDEEIKSFLNNPNSNKLPDSAFIIGNIIKKGGDQIDENNFSFSLNVIGGPSAANIFGRFAHGSEEIYDFSKEILRKEEEGRPESIYAEIVHLPQARTGNIILRPVLRKYEIPYIGNSGTASEFQILLEDIVVGVKQNVITLRSKKHNKYITPRLSTAHNYRIKNLPLYKFLCDIQRQGLYQSNVWDWKYLSSLKSLPRVIFKNIIVKKAQWRIEEKDIINLPDDTSEYINYFIGFREKMNLPWRVVYTEYDNELLIDFNSIESINTLLVYLRRYKSVLLKEFLFNESNCVVVDTSNAPYTNEVVIPIYKNNTVKKEVHKSENIRSIKRIFPPQSEWIYFKIYCGPKTAEKLLTEHISPFVENALRSGLFEKFFFVKYADTFHHLRIRFFNKKIEKQITIEGAFLDHLKPLLNSSAIDKIQIDTYNRELERYYPDLIEEAESIFFNDSLFILRLFKLIKPFDSERLRVLLALKSIDMLLNDFNVDLTGKKELANQLQQSYFKEFGANIMLQKQLNEKYRTFQKDIFLEFDKKNDAQFYHDALWSRSEMNRDTVNTMIAKLSCDVFNRIRLELLNSYIHMSMNRFFVAKQRHFELMVYHFLDKFYTSCIAINK